LFWWWWYHSGFRSRSGLGRSEFRVLGQPGFGLQYQLVSSLLPGDPQPANIFWLVNNGYITATN
jgi:hypothetical protein